MNHIGPELIDQSPQSKQWVGIDKPAPAERAQVNARGTERHGGGSFFSQAGDAAFETRLRQTRGQER